VTETKIHALESSKSSSLRRSDCNPQITQITSHLRNLWIKLGAWRSDTALFSTGAVETEGRATALQTTKESPHDQFKKNIRTYRNISHLSLERGSRRGCVRPGLANFTFFWA